MLLQRRIEQSVYSVLLCASRRRATFQGRSSGANEGSGSRTSSVLPDLLSQAGQPTTPPRHDKSTSEEVSYYNGYKPALMITTVATLPCPSYNARKNLLTELLQSFPAANSSVVRHTLRIYIVLVDRIYLLFLIILSIT